MAPPVRRRGTGRYRWIPRLVSAFIIVSFGLCIVTPLVFISVRMRMNRSISCPSCYCDCSFQDFLPIPRRLINYNYNSSFAEIDREMMEELRKERLTLIKEELDLLKIVSDDNMQRYKSLIASVKKTSSHYQKEAENCNIAVTTCEQARERAQQELVKERKLTALWEKRADILATP